MRRVLRIARAERGGYRGARRRAVDQDLLSQAAGTVVSRPRDTDSLPAGEQGRRDYRLTTALCRSSRTSRARRRAASSKRSTHYRRAPRGDSVQRTLVRRRRCGGVFDVAGALEHPVTLVANLATRHLWGARPHPTAARLPARRRPSGPPADWDVGHFACVVGRASGPGGSLYVVADTYPSLGSAGVHLQPQERLAVALARPGMPPGGLIVVASAPTPSSCAPAPRARARRGSSGTTARVTRATRQ